MFNIKYTYNNFYIIIHLSNKGNNSFVTNIENDNFLHGVRSVIEVWNFVFHESLREQVHNFLCQQKLFLEKKCRLS